jgi:chorismate mutase
MIGIASGWARKDPVAAARWAAALPIDDPARVDALKDALSYWKLQDPEAAEKFSDALPEKEQPH